MLLPDLVRHNGQWRSRHPALVTARETLSWAEFAGRVERVANGLADEGLAGERIGMVMENEAAAVEIIFGAMLCGAIVVPLNLSIADDAIETLLVDAEIAALAASPAQCQRITPSASALAKLRLCSGERDGWQTYAAWRDAQVPEATCPSPSPDSLCNIIYSSGTTGRPKGISHTQQARIDWTHDLAHALRYHSGARTLIATGIYSNISWVSMLPTVMLGGTIHLHDGFDVPAILADLESARITHMSMVPVQLQRLLEHSSFNPASFGTLQSVMCCGSPLAAGLKVQLLDLLPLAFFELYGSTEGIITTLAPEDAPSRMGSVGLPLPGEHLAILGADNTLLGPGEPGEIVAASRFAMAGYWRRPDATAEAQWLGSDGQVWLRSGDIGHLDADGYLTITDRKKDMIISGGQNIYPADLEAVLLAHSDVSDCAVIGVPSETWGETPLALVVAREGCGPDPATLLAWANGRLGRQQKIGAIEIREELPRNPNGKLLKRELREPYWQVDAEA